MATPLILALGGTRSGKSRYGLAAACHVANGDRGDDGHSLQLVRANTNITPGTVVVLTMDDGTWTVRNVTAVNVAAVPADNCTAVPHAVLEFAPPPADPTGMNVNGNLCAPSALAVPMGTAAVPCDVLDVGYGEVVRYRTQVGPDGVPVLQRSSTANPAAGFQTIARGIDELQVQYITAGLDPTVAANWVDDAPLVQLPGSANPWPSIISQVRVTLSARSEAPNIAGARSVAFGPDAMRGSLTATASPRSSLLALTMQPVPPAPAPPPHLWR